MIWSILICTLENRKKEFEFIYNKLLNQIKENNLENEIEIIYFKDNKENTVGFKRNFLLEKSTSQYISFIDDDDDISNNYIKLIYNTLLNNPDCVSLNGIITFNENNPRQFIHSIKYNKYFEENNIYYRPPNHLNPIKRDIAILFKFPEINHGEDTDWAMQICNSNLLKTEIIIDECYYYYKYNSKK